MPAPAPVSGRPRVQAPVVLSKLSSVLAPVPVVTLAAPTVRV